MVINGPEKKAHDAEGSGDDRKQETSDEEACKPLLLGPRAGDAEGGDKGFRKKIKQLHATRIARIDQGLGASFTLRERIPSMLITPLDLEREPLEFNLTFEPGSIDYGGEIHQIGPMLTSGTADLIKEHRGPREIIADIRLRGNCSGKFEVPCARCLDTVEHEVNSEFDLLFRPVGVDHDSSEHAVTTSETEIGYYLKDGLVLEDVLREQVLLALPARSLCGPDCKGLCPHCGSNLNTDACNCDAAPADPRWSALSDLRSRIKT
ncbi:uncharacterized protein C7378_0023 [Acidipila rosea]|uniref:DUF177 domain-containing protein n=2 Tax=Acidipila rosea TaxID=768535 RepID=A0A4R1LA44_9BACT|nr:uncharacterized protein C7378_0023 [Acidipila rosea]